MIFIGSIGSNSTKSENICQGVTTQTITSMNATSIFTSESPVPLSLRTTLDVALARAHVAMSMRADIAAEILRAYVADRLQGSGQPLALTPADWNNLLLA